MNALIKYVNRLQEITIILKRIFSKNENGLNTWDKKTIINYFIEINDIKKGMAKILFGKDISARARILSYLKENVGKTVTGKELAEVAGISEYARRIRELRHECGGWHISTGMNRAGLKPDEYFLEDLEQEPEYERMNAETWARVLERDNFTCQNCGWRKGDPQTNNRKFLEVHHCNIPVKERGLPIDENLITLCNVCHDAS